jgi:hypothetical protein
MSDINLNDVLGRLQALEAEIALLKAPTGSHRDTAPDADRSLSIPEEAPTSRRALMRAGAAALGAAAMAVLPGKRAEAANGDPIVVGGTHSGTATTSLSAASSGATEFATLRSECTAPTAFGAGVWGESHSGYGVVGSAMAETGFNAGVYGESRGIGVFGQGRGQIGTPIGVVGVCHKAEGNGVRGINTVGGSSVLGEVPSDAMASGIGVYGANYSPYAGPGPGAGGFGAYGFSLKGHGLVGATGTAGGAALVGASNGIAGAYAAAFYGPVVITGDLAVVGAKSAAVPFPDGVHRRVYCVESPESWFEDFGKAQLVLGGAEVTIDPRFAAIANMDDYYVFLTPYGQHSDLMVSEQTPCGFRVSAKNAASGASFFWRVVAKRKDITGERLAPVTIPVEPALPVPIAHPSFLIRNP